MMDFETCTLRFDANHRGGGIEIDLTAFGYEGERMTAYQNYLGGGMLGRVCNDCTIKSWKENKSLLGIAEELARYFHELTRHSEDEYEDMEYEKNQSMPISAYWFYS